jgi:hypothetical protein
MHFLRQQFQWLNKNPTEKYFKLDMQYFYIIDLLIRSNTKFVSLELEHCGARYKFLKHLNEIKKTIFFSFLWKSEWKCYMHPRSTPGRSPSSWQWGPWPHWSVEPEQRGGGFAGRISPATRSPAKRRAPPCSSRQPAPGGCENGGAGGSGARPLPAMAHGGGGRAVEWPLPVTARRGEAKTSSSSERGCGAHENVW